MKRTKEGPNGPSKYFLLAAVLLAAAFSIGCWWSGEPVWTDSTEYLHGGVSFFSGKGFASIYGGPQDTYTPGLPLAIGLLNLATRDPILAGRLVVLLASVGSLIPLVLIASRLFGKNAGIATGLVYAVLPIRVQLSLAIMTESVFVFLILLGTWLWLKEADSHKWTRAAGMGAILGYAYLVRPEGLLCGLVLLALAFLARRFGPTPPPRSVLIAVIAMAVVAFPYVLYLHGVTGRWALSDKHFTYSCCQWSSEGAPLWVTHKLNKDATEIPWDAHPESPKQFLMRVAKNALLERREVSIQIGKLLVAILILGLGLELYRRNEILLRAAPVLLALGLPLLYLPILFPEPRLVFTGVLSVVVLACWLLMMRFEAAWANGHRSWFAGITMWLPLMIICMFLAAGSRSMLFANRTPTDVALTASWVKRYVPVGSGVMAVLPQVVYHADLHPVRFTYDEIHRVLHYCRVKKADYILFRLEDKKWYDQKGYIAQGVSQGSLTLVGRLPRSSRHSAAWLYRISTTRGTHAYD